MLTPLVYLSKRNTEKYRMLNKCDFIGEKDLGISFYKYHFRPKTLKSKTMYKTPSSFKTAGSYKREFPIYLRCSIKCDLKEESSVSDVPPISFIKRALL